MVLYPFELNYHVLDHLPVDRFVATQVEANKWVIAIEDYLERLTCGDFFVPNAAH